MVSCRPELLTGAVAELYDFFPDAEEWQSEAKEPRVVKAP